MGLWTWFDRPLRITRGRSARELLVIGVAVATAIRFWRVDPGGSAMFAVVALGFLLRVFAARVVAMGVAVSATCLHLVGLLDPAADLQVGLLGVAYFLTAILILRGRALVARFDDGPGRFNFWRSLPVADRRSLARVAYGMGVTGAALYYARVRTLAWGHPVPWWIDGGIAALVVLGVLMLAGRALVGLATAAVMVALAVGLGSQAPLAIHVISGDFVPLSTPTVARHAPALVLAATAAAALTAALAVPWAVRLLRHLRHAEHRDR